MAVDEGVPLPQGWIGTTNDWVRGFGIGFALLNLVLLGFAWHSLGRAGTGPTARGWLLVAVGLVPVMVAFLAFAHGLERSATVTACASHHVMTPFVEDLRNVKSETCATTSSTGTSRRTSATRAIPTTGSAASGQVRWPWARVAIRRERTSSRSRS